MRCCRPCSQRSTESFKLFKLSAPSFGEIEPSSSVHQACYLSCCSVHRCCGAVHEVAGSAGASVGLRGALPAAALSENFAKSQLRRSLKPGIGSHARHRTVLLRFQRRITFEKVNTFFFRIQILNKSYGD